MPKTSDNYLDNKRNMILDAAQQIASEKPLAHVTMRDIIRKCDVSQGAIYHYFSGLDEIWLAMIDRFYAEDDITKDIEEVLRLDEPPQLVLKKAAERMGDNLLNTIPQYGKIIMELNTTILANPNMYQKMLSSQKGYSRLGQLEDLFEKYCIKKLKEGVLHPVVSSESIGYYLASSYLGLRYQATVLYLTSEPGDISLTDYMRMQIITWTKSMIYLLGINE